MSIAWLTVPLGVYAWARWCIYRQTANHQANLARYGRWHCPSCHREYGAKVHYIPYGKDHIVVLHDGPFVRHVILICPHCGYSQAFDPSGKSHPSLGGHSEEYAA